MGFEVIWNIQGGQTEIVYFADIFTALEKVQQLRDLGIENWLICSDMREDPYKGKILDFRKYGA